MSFMPSPSRFPADRGQDQAETDDIIGRDVSSAVKSMAFLVFGLGAAAAFVPLGGAVVGSGQLNAETQVKRIANPIPGMAIIAKTFVRDGDHVKIGDPLVQLDATVSNAERRLSTMTLHQLLAQRARLEAESRRSTAITFPGELATSTDPGAIKAMADETRLFRARQDELSGMRVQLAAQLEQNLRQEQGLRAQISSLESQRNLIEPERAGMENLWKRGLVTISRKNQLERQVLDAQGNIASLQAQVAQGRAHNVEVREQISQLGRTRSVQSASDLETVNAALNEQKLRSVASAQQVRRSLVRAPSSGTVNKLAITAIGDVLTAAQPMLEIVPDQDRLVVEAAVSPADIDRVRRDQRVRVRLGVSSGNATPELTGKVEYVSASSATDDDKQTSFFLVRVSIDPQAIPASLNAALRTGVPAEVFIQTGSRSMLSYLTRPLRDQFARAFLRD